MLRLEPPVGREHSHVLWMHEQPLYRDAGVALLTAADDSSSELKAASLNQAYLLLGQAQTLAAVQVLVWADGA